MLDILAVSYTHLDVYKRQIFARIHEHPIRPQVVGYSSDNNTELFPRVQDVINEYSAQFISGRLDVDADWDAYVQAVNAAGYETLQQEVQEYMSNK